MTTVLSFWRVAPSVGETTTSDSRWAMAIACVVVLVVLATDLVGPVTGLPVWVPACEVAEKPPTIATARSAPTTATPATKIAVPPALNPS